MEQNFDKTNKFPLGTLLNQGSTVLVCGEFSSLQSVYMRFAWDRAHLKACPLDISEWFSQVFLDFTECV